MYPNTGKTECIAAGMTPEVGLKKRDKYGRDTSINTCIHGKTLLRKTWRRLLSLPHEPGDGVNIVTTKGSTDDGTTTY